MRIQIASDLHGEFQQDRGISLIQEMSRDDHIPPDVLVLAGDCVTERSGFNLLEEACNRYKTVLFVAGNHEYYRSTPKRVNSALTVFQDQHPNFHFMNKKSVTIDGKRFHGCTLWFEETEKSANLEFLMNDFRVINTDRYWFYRQNRECVDFLKNNVQEGDIVITHHLPSYACIDPKWFGEASNCFYANDLDQFIKDRKPAMWIHGHSHEQLDFVHHNTRMLRNPHGYKGEQCNWKFKWDFTVEV